MFKRKMVYILRYKSVQKCLPGECNSSRARLSRVRDYHASLINTYRTSFVHYFTSYSSNVNEMFYVKINFEFHNHKYEVLNL